MKNFKRIEATPDTDEFTFHDIEKALFDSVAPSVTVAPFPSITRLATLKVPMRIHLPLHEEAPEEALVRGVSSTCLQLPMWCVHVLQKEYQDLQRKWAEYLLESLKEFCETSTLSAIMWSTLSAGQQIFPEVTTERTLWIHACRTQDTRTKQQFQVDLIESLHPWINSKLYHEIQQKKNNKRENVEYDKQRQKLIRESMKVQ